MRINSRHLAGMGLMLILMFSGASEALSQTNDEDWSIPDNLSQSGSATAPQLVKDSTNTFHIFWRNEADNSYFYTTGLPVGWSAPSPIEVPFGTRQYFPDLDTEDATPLFQSTLLADEDDRIHAFWIDDKGTLWSSWVQFDQVTNFESWSDRQQLDEAVVDLSVAVDDSSRVYLSYLSSQQENEFPPGIYYRRLDAPDEDWTSSILLYESAYFQELTADRANIELFVIDSGETHRVVVVWDNQPIEKVFLSLSMDGGESWGEPEIVDQRQIEDGLDTRGPANIQVSGSGSNMIIIWQAGHGFVNCSQYYQWSRDAGSRWSDPGIMLEGFGSCPEKNKFIPGTDDLSLLFTVVQNQPYLITWNGFQWSNPQRQALNDFVSSDTYRRIEFGCHQLSLLEQSQLMAVGCGMGSEDQVGDIWETSRPFGETSSWYPPPPAWVKPKDITVEFAELLDIQLVGDSEGRFHAFWSQPNDGINGFSTIRYARWDNDVWTPTISILSTPADYSTKPAVVLGLDDHLLATWVSGAGEAFFSHSSSDQAIISRDWSIPISVPAPEAAINAADIAVDQDGNIHLTYAIPINENRGIYLTTSFDDGKSWSEPTIVFNGAEAGWSVVGPPHISTTDDGNLHLIWTKQAANTVDGSIKSDALFYTRSSDQGVSFDEPQAIISSLVIWNELVSDGQTIHRLWQEQMESITSLRHEYSIDGGVTWSSPLRLNTDPSPAAVVADISGQLHLVQAGDSSLTHFTWEGESWRQDEELELSNDQIARPQVGAAFTPDDTLGVIFITIADNSSDAQNQVVLSSSWRTITLPSVPVTPADVDTSPLSDMTPTIESSVIQDDVASSTPIAVASPTSSESTNTLDDVMDIVNSDNEVVRWILIIALTVLFLLIVFAVVWRSARSARN